ncbi:MAG: hypothetical protein KBC56_08010 [Flavobacterium sp.]|nr:hypothetical protein [Flavobacterium sp.]
MEAKKIITQYLTDVKHPLTIKSYIENYQSLFDTIDFSIDKELLEPPLNNYCSSLEGAIENILEFLKTNNIKKDYYFILGEQINTLLHKFESKMIEIGIDNRDKKSVKEVYSIYMELAKQTDPTKNKKYLPHAYEIEKEFKEFIKIETPEPKQPEANESVNKKKFEVLLNFANGEYYKLQQNGYSNNKIAETIFSLTDQKEIKNYAQYFKCTNTNKPEDKQNKSKNLFQNIELLNKVIKHCKENKITIHNQFQKEYSKINQNKYD